MKTAFLLVITQHMCERMLIFSDGDFSLVYIRGKVLTIEWQTAAAITNCDLESLFLMETEKRREL